MLYFSATSKRMHFLHQSLTNIEFISKIGNDFTIVQCDTIRIWKHVEKYQINVKKQSLGFSTSMNMQECNKQTSSVNDIMHFNNVYMYFLPYLIKKN